ncbi:hypothetical protein EDC19_1245 [Natranaerovirga hydrolytica]|uniref:Uncharacterized protein n=1 Tax=Natranaerovirga hydrolytica TaxID=680378 RepID=A0A4R1MZT6_9FIRM|nr:hypothetical protein [Natranaerovirga hydrolytica]TCK98806.1 hypothetical protein EDC19_1245 [Natranaerovirga hydrolytica]
MNESTFNSLPQQGSQKNRNKKGLQQDPGIDEKTDLKKHFNKNNKSYQSKEKS